MKNIQVLGSPFHYGQIHPGVKFSYRHLKEHFLFDRLEELAPTIDLGELNLLSENFSPSPSSVMKNHHECALANQTISEFISGLNLWDSFLLHIGGDHGLGCGSVHGLLNHYPDSLVVWADAHGDINTPHTSQSKNFHGMPLGHLLGLVEDEKFRWMNKFLHPRKIILFGVRDLDQAEKKIINTLGIQTFTTDEINLYGHEKLLQRALSLLDPRGEFPIHLSLDVDLFDPLNLHSTGTRVKEGPRTREILGMGAYLAGTGRLRSLDLVEFNPLIGNHHEVTQSRELIFSFLDTIFKEIFLQESFRLKTITSPSPLSIMKESVKDF